MPLIKSERKSQWRHAAALTTVANTVLLVGAAYQIYGAAWAIYIPRAFCTFITRVLDPLVEPWPILQTINIVIGAIILFIEILSIYKPLNRFILLKAVFYTGAAIPAFLLLNTVNASVILLYGAGLLTWGYCVGEAMMDKKQSIVQRKGS